MGIDISAMLIFGVSHKELEDLDYLDEMLDDGVLDYASPYYDSSRNGWVVGVELPNEMATVEAMAEAVIAASERFEKLTGCKMGRLIVSPHVT